MAERIVPPFEGALARMRQSVRTSGRQVHMVAVVDSDISRQMVGSRWELRCQSLADLLELTRLLDDWHSDARDKPEPALSLFRSIKDTFDFLIGEFV